MAAYKLTYDPECAAYLEVDWSKIDESLWSDEYDDASEELEDLGSPERRLSFPWIFAEALFTLLS